MISNQEISGLLGLLYEAPLEDAKWQIFLTCLAQITQVAEREHDV